ncbi:MAG TPA: hypothetical protein VL092_08100 [Chitinophagaceae bacterium]|nr:hypothetical protein [Chitinophagaceae bacterium]
MKKIFLQKLLIVCSALTALSYGVLWACGWSDWDEYGVSAFTPEAFTDSAYRPFFYSDMFYYQIGHDNNHVHRFDDAVVRDWQDYLGKSRSDTEVRYFLLTASAGQVDTVLQQKVKTLPAQLAAMKLVQDKGSKKANAFFAFLHYAKANESYATTWSDYWGYDEKQQWIPLSPAQIKDRELMIKAMKEAPDAFIGQRYFFQLVRSYFFSLDYETCIAFYGQYKDRFPDNMLAARTQGYVAGAYYKQKDYAHANYLYSRVYDAGDELKTVAHFSFHPQEETDWQQTLALCRTKQEQATLWHLLGVYFDEERAISEIYKLDPASNKLDLLLTRLVNIQENRANAESTEYGGAAYTPRRDSLSKKALKLVSAIADEGKTAKPYLWLLSAGYLHFINEDYAKAAQYYAQARQTLPVDLLPQAQVRLLVLMNKVAAAKIIDQQKESELLDDLVWLQSQTKDPIPYFRFSYADDWIKRIMAGKYRRQKDILHAELFVHTDSFFSSPARVAQLKTFLLDTHSGPFDQYCQSIYPITVPQVSEFQYMSLAYQDKIGEALELISRSAAVEDAELPGNPFNGTIRDCHDCDHAAPQKVKYTKVSLLRKMKEMQDSATAGKDVYNNNLLLGNAFYNMSHYGNARYFYEGAVIGEAHYSPVELPAAFQPMLISQVNAKEYYRKALNAAVTDEQKAKVSYLMLKCERNELYNQLYKNPEYSAWSYAGRPATNFAPLQRYKQTAYYKEVLKECGYFQAWLGKR